MVVVGFDPGADGEDIGIEDDVVGVEVEFVPQQFIAALAYRSAPLQRIRLPLLVEGHDHDRRAITLAQGCLFQEFLRPGLQADGIDYRFARYALQSGLDHCPLGGVHHDRYASDVGLRGHQVQEPHHGLLGLEHAFIHVDIDDLRAVFHLGSGYLQRLLKTPLQDQPFKPGRPGNVAALTHVDEVFALKTKALETTQLGVLCGFGEWTWRMGLD